jgi:hypothetical protein
LEGGFAMSKVLFAISLMTLLACGSGDSDSEATGSAAADKAVSAAASAADKAEMAKEAPTGDGGQAKAEAAEISSCIRLVAAGDYETAVPVCLQAAKIDADNADVQAALKKAETEAAKEAATGAASDAAADALGGLGN